jgi:DNA-binding XRE family transcriptional regulator
MIKFIGVDGKNAVNSEMVLKQISEVKEYELDIFDIDGNKINWSDLENENNRSLFKNILMDRKTRIDEGKTMADRPPFIAVTVEENKIIRLEFYEGHDSLELIYDLRQKQDIGKELKPYMEKDENSYNPVEFLGSLGIDKSLAEKVLSMVHKSVEDNYTLKELRVKNNIQKKVLAKKLGLSAQGYTWKEDGEREFTVSELEILCKEFNKSYKEMVNIINNSKSKK